MVLFIRNKFHCQHCHGYSKLHFVESLEILCYICSNGSIIRNIPFEDFIAMDIPSYISLNQLKYYVTYVAIVLHTYL